MGGFLSRIRESDILFVNDRKYLVYYNSGELQPEHSFTRSDLDNAIVQEFIRKNAHKMYNVFYVHPETDNQDTIIYISTFVGMEETMEDISEFQHVNRNADYLCVYDLQAVELYQIQSSRVNKEYDEDGFLTSFKTDSWF